MKQYSEIIFIDNCTKCKKEYGEYKFIYGKKVCIECFGKEKKYKQNITDAIKKFYKKVYNMRGKVNGEYINQKTQVNCICKNGHKCNPTPDSVKRNGMCRICSGNDPETAKQNFIKNIKNLGGEVVGEYINSQTKVECKCKNGHKCNPTPNKVNYGEGMCRKCANHCPETAKQNFYDNIQKLRGKVIGEYKTCEIKVECICKNGHKCYPTPTHIQQKGGMCSTCAGNTVEIGKQKFFKRMSENEINIIGKYKNNHTSVECICKNGHTTFLIPSSVSRRVFLCYICYGYNNQEIAKQNFIENIKKLEGTIIGEYINKYTPVDCKCGQGHSCSPTPSCIRDGWGMCPICSNTCPETAKQNFIKNIQNLGGTVVGEYINSQTKVECKCKKGHLCNPIPGNIQQGKSGLCKECFDVDLKENSKQHFYMLIHEKKGKVIGPHIDKYSPIDCECSQGHICKPKPVNIRRTGGDICLKCVNRCPESSEKNFYDSINKMGAQVIGSYINCKTAVDCICKNGHECKPRPNMVQQGRDGICKKCSNTGYSKICIKWLNSISNDIQHAENGQEFKIPNTKYKVDGYNVKTNTVYEFHGCYWHGCPLCFSPVETNKTNKKLFIDLYNKTLKRSLDIKHNGYNLVEIWECNFMY
jgi:hypothetical protein